MYELRRRIRMWGGDFDGRDLYCNSTITNPKCDVTRTVSQVDMCYVMSDPYVLRYSTHYAYVGR